jgi:predicted aldo/keto reductase-like oxidoreductase
LDYVDTAYRYHSGNSERVLGRILKDGYRDKIKLATKSPIMMIKSAQEYDKILDEQLQKLDVDYIDYYLFHGLSSNGWKNVQHNDLISRAEAAQQAGKIRHIGFSFHDSFEAFEEIVNGYDKWALCQVQYNLMDENNQAGIRGLRLAAEKNIAVVVMEPLRGGKLATPIKEVSECMEKHGYTGTLADLALRWVWNHPEVSVILSGMTTMGQMQENLVTVETALPGTMSEQEHALVREIRGIYQQRGGIPCTGCSYCLPCPQGIGIPGTLNFYNEGVIYEYFNESKRVYNVMGAGASKCVSCKECEEKCPQSIPISEWMVKIHDLLGNK